MNIELKNSIESDLFRYFGTKKLSLKMILKAHFFEPQIGFTIAWRKYKFYKKNRCRLRAVFYKYKLIRYGHKFGFQFSYDAEIGDGMYIGHCGRIIFGAVKIGKNLNVGTGVTIGAVNGNSPTIGDNVWIGTNAVVVGDIEIGDDVLISPNTFVYHSIPSHSTVRGNPSVVKPKLGATDKVITNRV